MGFEEFWIKGNDNQKHRLNEFRGEIRRDMFDEKYQNLFNVYDTNQSGTLDAEELKLIFKHLKLFAGSDKTLNVNENSLFASAYEKLPGLEDIDFMGFIKSASEASALVKNQSSQILSDGLEVVTTFFDDGVLETVVYYPNGDFLMKKTEICERTSQVSYVMENSQGMQIRLSKKDWERYKAMQEMIKNNPASIRDFPYNMNLADIQTSRFYTTDQFRQPEEVLYEISQQGYADLEERSFIMNHYLQTNESAAQANASMGPLDYVGAGINWGVGEFLDLFDSSEYESYFDVSEKFENTEHRFYKAKISFDPDVVKPEDMFIGFADKFSELSNYKNEYSSAEAKEFHRATMQYEQTKTLEYQISILQKAKRLLMEADVDSAWYTQLSDMPGDYSRAYNNPEGKIQEVLSLLEEFFGDKELAETLINEQLHLTRLGEWDSTNLRGFLSSLEEHTNETLKKILDGKSSEDVKNEYFNKYKAMYGVDVVPDAVVDKVYGAKGTASMAKLFAIMAITTLISRSPKLSQTVGSLAVRLTPILSRFMTVERATVLAPKIAAEIMRFSMATGTVGLDVGIEATNMALSDAGINGEELLEKGLGAAKYIYFGSYIGGPMANWVGKNLSQTQIAKNLFKGCQSVSQDGKVIRAMNGADMVRKVQSASGTLLVQGGKLATDITAFAGLDMLTTDTDLFEAFGASGEMMLEIKIMHHVLQYIIGGKVNNAVMKAKMDNAIERSGVKEWMINEVRSEDGKTPVRYELTYKDIPIIKCESQEAAIVLMMQHVAKNYEAILREEANLPPKDEQNMTQSSSQGAEASTTSGAEQVASTAQAPVLKKLSDIAEPELIERYKQLQGEAVKNESVERELLELTFELWERGYRPKFNEMDFSAKIDSPNLTDSNLTKAEFMALLKDYGVKDNCLEIIEYNIERINKEMLSKINTLEFLNNPECIGIFCDVKPEDVPAKIAAYEAIKNNTNIDAKTKAIIISLTNATTQNQRLVEIGKIAETIDYMKKANPEGVVDSYAVVERMLMLGKSFNREMFDALKESWDLVTKTDICFDVKPEEISVKLEAFNKIKENKNINFAEQRDIIQRATVENMPKIEILNELVNQGYKRINDYLAKMDKIDVGLLNVLKENPQFIDFIDLGSLQNVATEVVQAKLEIMEYLKDNENAYDAAKRQLFEATTNENLPAMKKVANLLSNSHFNKFDALMYSADKINPEIFDIVVDNVSIANNINFTELARLKPEEINIAKRNLSFINEKTKISKTDSSNFILEDGKINFKTFVALLKNYKTMNPDLLALCKNEFFEDASLGATVEMLNNVKPEDLPVKLEVFEKVRDNSNISTERKIKLVDEVEASTLQYLDKQIELITKYEENRKIEGRKFTPDEERVREEKLIRAFEIIDSTSRKVDEKNSLKELLGNARNMEEFLAKYEAIIQTSGGIGPWRLQDVFLREQVELAKKYNVEIGFNDVFADVNQFVDSYKFIAQVNPMDVNSPKIMSTWDYAPKIKTQAKFDKIRFCAEDPRYLEYPTEELLSEPARWEAYQKLRARADYMDIPKESFDILIKEIYSGKSVPDVSDINAAVKQIKNNQILDLINDYKEGNIKGYLWYDESSVNVLLANYPEVDVTRYKDVTYADTQFLKSVVENNKNFAYPNLGNFLNTVDLAAVSKRRGLLEKASDPVALKLLQVSDAEFDNIVAIIEKRPEILTKKLSEYNFFRCLKMSEAEWQNFNCSLSERRSGAFDENAYREHVRELSSQEYTPDMSVYKTLDVKRIVEAASGADRYYAAKVRVNPEAMQKPVRKVVELPSSTELMSQLETTGSVSLSIEDKGGMSPARTDAPVIKDVDRSRLGVTKSSEVSINIGKTREWDNNRLARDILQNFYDGNGYTLEGVTISVKDLGNGQYSIKIDGKGLYDYDRLLDWGDSSKPDKPRSAGYNGEGTKIIAGNLLLTKGASSVKYSAGEWELAFSMGEKNVLGETEIMQTLTEAKEYKDGTSVEFVVNDKDFVHSILKAKDFFYSPNNPDFANTTFENDYFAIKMLPKGEKGNLYLVQRYEIDGRQGYDGTLDGMTLIFKQQPNGRELLDMHNGRECDVKTGRNRVALTSVKIKELVRRYAKTMTNEELINTIASMENIYIIDNQTKDLNSRIVLEALIEEAYHGRSLKIDFGHNDFLACDPSNGDAIAWTLRSNKIPILADFSNVGIPDFYRYYKASEDASFPRSQITPVQSAKIQLLNEATQLFAEALNFENCEVISIADAQSPKYIDATSDKQSYLARAITDETNASFYGHWLKDSAFDRCGFYDLLGTWLHEASHKIAGDGTKSFNERLIKVQQLIMDISANNPAFLRKLEILAEEYERVAKTENPNFSNEATSVNLKQSEPNFYTSESGYQVPVPPENRFDYKTLTRPNPAPMREHQSAKRVERDMQILESTGELSLRIPKTSSTRPQISTTEILPVDRESLGVTENTKVLLTYGNSQAWSYDVIARDLLQNFYDGHGQTLDGVNIEIKNVDGKYKVKVSGLSEYNITI